MTQPAQDENAVHPFRARNQLIQAVRTRLKSTGLDVRERARELVISKPGHPDQGRIYITYRSGEPPALDDRVEADLLHVTRALVDGAERHAVVEIGHGDLMPGGAQLVGEVADAVGEALAVMEQDDVGH